MGVDAQDATSNHDSERVAAPGSHDSSNHIRRQTDVSKINSWCPLLHYFEFVIFFSLLRKLSQCTKAIRFICYHVLTSGADESRVLHASSRTQLRPLRNVIFCTLGPEPRSQNHVAASKKQQRGSSGILMVFEAVLQDLGYPVSSTLEERDAH